MHAIPSSDGKAEFSAAITALFIQRIIISVFLHRWVVKETTATTSAIVCFSDARLLF